MTQTVDQDGSTTVVSSAAHPSVYGQSVTFTAIVTANTPGSGTPTGSVTFMDGSTNLGNGTLSGGKATFKTSALAVGSHAIAVVYGGDTNFITSTSAVLNQAVNQDGTSTALSSSVNPSVFGQSVTFTVTVTAAAPGSGTPTGSVTFLDGSTTLDTATLSGGKATFKTSALAVGTQSITVLYGGDANFTTSTSPVLTQTVNQDQTTTELASSANPSVYGQLVTFTATVSAAAPGGGTPTGSVTFMDGSTAIGNGSLSSGKVTFTTSSLAVGSHAITAVYGGDGNFSTSTSTAINQRVNQAGSSTTVVSSANPSLHGQLVTFTATVSAVSPGSGTPTGTVTFKDGSTTLGTAMLSGRTASLSISTLAVGAHSIKVVYGGDSNFKTSTSAVLNQVNSANELLSAHNGTADPTTENFTWYTGQGSPVGPVAKDQGLPAWEITSSNINDQAEYIDQRPLSASQTAEVASQGFTETLVARVTRNNGLAPAFDQYPAIIASVSTDVLGSSSPRFDIDLAINSKGDTVVILPSTVNLGSQGGVVATGLTDTLTGSGSSYHTYQLYYNPATSSANLYIDGNLALPLSGYTGETQYLGYTRLYWGTTSGGQGFYNEVKLETGKDIVSQASPGVAGFVANASPGAADLVTDASPVDQALAALTGNESHDSLVELLALEQVSAQGRSQSKSIQG